MKAPSAAAAAAEIVLILTRQPPDRQQRIFALVGELLELDPRRRRLPLTRRDREPLTPDDMATSSTVNGNDVDDGTRGTVRRILEGQPR